VRLYVTRYTCSLREVINDRKQEIAQDRNEFWTSSEIARFCVDIVTGLEFLHKHKVIHRDLKSDNIFVNLDVHNELRLLAIGDFDTAKAVKNNTEVPKTIIGTPGYMAPEVYNAQTQGAYTFKADVWSFGMVIYELMTLKQPYEDVEMYGVPGLVSSGQRPSVPIEREQDLPKELLTIFKQCTMLDPNKRPDIGSLKASFHRICWEEE